LKKHEAEFRIALAANALKRAEQIASGGKYHLSVDGVELKQAFEAIAADVTAL